MSYYCGDLSNVASPTAISCQRHPNGANKGKHELTL